MAGRVKRELGYEPSVKFIKDILGSEAKVVPYYAAIARKLNSKNAALMLQQLVYWRCRTQDPDGWVYKTIKEMENELALSRYEQETAIHILTKYELIEKQVKGLPPKRYFMVNLERVDEFLKEIVADKRECQNAEN